MADLERLNRTFAEGDPLLPADVNRLSRHSATYQAAVEREHDAGGAHKGPFVATAAAHVNWSGTDYSLGPSHGVASVKRLGGGRVEIILSESMRSAQKWGLIAWQEIPSEDFSSPTCPSELAGSKSSDRVELMLPMDGPFTLMAWDSR